MNPYENPCEDWKPASEDEWERFWRLVKFEAEHEPDRADYYEQLEDLERQRRIARMRELAKSDPFPPDALGITVEQALATLAGVRRAGRDSWMARCPVHEDSSPSLLVSESERWPGQALFHCFAGCNFLHIKAAIREAM